MKTTSTKLTLFLAAFMMAIDLITLVATFLQGELSIRFLLKVAAVMVAILAGLGGKLDAMVLAVFAGLVGAALAGMLISGYCSRIA